MKNIHRIALSTLVLAGLAAVPLTMARASVSTAGSKVLAVTVFAPNSLGNVWPRSLRRHPPVPPLLRGLRIPTGGKPDQPRCARPAPRGSLWVAPCAIRQ